MTTATTDAVVPGDAPAERRRDGFRPDIQGLRAVAVLLVVLYHADVAFPGGFVGVDMFFVVSGFVIARTLVRELGRTGRVDLREFYARRVRRLLPALAVVSTVTVLLALLALSPTGPQESAAKTGLAASLFGGNLFLLWAGGDYFAPADEANPFLHTWSLSVEEQFYLLLPVALMATWRVARRSGRVSPRMAVGGLAVVAGALSLVASWAFTAGHGPGSVEVSQRLAFYSPVTRVWEFMAGVLLAVVAARVGGARGDGTAAGRDAGGPSSWGVVAGLTGLAGIAYASLAFDRFTPFPGLAAAVPVAGTVLLLVAGRASPLVGAVLGSRPLVWIGDLSYGWYLWHWPAIVFTRLLWPGNDRAVVLVAVAALGPAWLSHRYVEAPVRRNRSLVGGRAVRLALVCIVVPAALSVVVLRGASTDWGLEQPPEWTEARLAVVSGCISVRARPWEADDCTFAVDDARGTVLLLGDSHASSAGDAVVGAANDLGWDAAVWARPGCPFLEDRPSYGQDGCAEWQRAALDLVGELDPDLVVIANRSPGYTLPSVPEDFAFRTITTTDGGEARTQDDALDSWGQGLDDLLATLGDRSVPALLFSVVPEYPQEVEAAQSLLRPTPPVPTLTLDDVAERRGPVVAVERRVAEAHDGVWTFDPVPSLCPDDRCRPFDGETWLYKDSHHLNAVGSRRLADPLERVMADALAPMRSR